MGEAGLGRHGSPGFPSRDDLAHGKVMLEMKGDIWAWADDSLVVVPTNVGWRFDGKNVMGAGVAKQAAAKYAGLAVWYGSVCRAFRENTPVVRYFRSAVLCFPVKPMASDPSLSWRQKADLELIARSTRQLAKWQGMMGWEGRVVLPVVGCGNGGLEEAAVMPILRRWLQDDRFVLVRLSKA